MSLNSIDGNRLVVLPNNAKIRVNPAAVVVTAWNRKARTGVRRYRDTPFARDNVGIVFNPEIIKGYALSYLRLGIRIFEQPLEPFVARLRRTRAV